MTDFFDKHQHDDFVAAVYEHNKEIIDRIDKEWKESEDKLNKMFPSFKGKHQYFDRMGNVIPVGLWGELFQTHEYRVLNHTYIEDYMLSTVWLGSNHNLARHFCDVTPHIFESMIFLKEGIEREDDHLAYYMERYSTQEEAMIGHEKMVEIARAGKIPEDEDEE